MSKEFFPGPNKPDFSPEKPAERLASTNPALSEEGKEKAIAELKAALGVLEKMEKKIKAKYRKDQNDIAREKSQNYVEMQRKVILEEIGKLEGIKK